MIVTEWLEYRNPDFERLQQLLRQPLIIDGRNLYDPGTHARRSASSTTAIGQRRP